MKRKFFKILISGLFPFLSIGIQTNAAVQKDTVVVYHKDTVYYLPVDKRREPLKARSPYQEIDNHLTRPILAFRSNLLMPLLNIGIEYPISNRWSAAADFYYPWCPRAWMNKWSAPQMTCVQGLGGYVEGRYWLGTRHCEHEADNGKYRLLGHSLGLIAAGAYYDLEFKGTGQQGEVLAVGVDYTYAIPVGKKCGVHLEFAFAIGAVCHIWHPYNVYEQGGYLLRQKDENNANFVSKINWSFFPIKAGINLSVPVFEREQKNKSGRK